MAAIIPVYFARFMAKIPSTRKGLEAQMPRPFELCAAGLNIAVRNLNLTAANRRVVRFQIFGKK